MSTASDLPTPSPESLARSQELRQTLLAASQADGGWLSFARFMELALYAPGLGYYSSGARQIGAAGDFTTAPQTSPLFGAALAQQLAQIMDHTTGELLELGPGLGVLAGDVLVELETLGCLPERYALLEVSGALRAQQQATIAARAPHLVERCVWLDALPATLTGAVFGNEVLDAMPVEWLVWHDQAWWQRGVRIDAALELALDERPAPVDLATQVGACFADPSLIPEGYATEFATHALGLVSTLSERLHKGAALFIDYGFPAAEFYHPQRSCGTLIAHYRQRAHGDVLLWPGLQDLTAHVDFTGVAERAHEAGCEILGYTSQARFLLNCNITDLIRSRPEQTQRWLPAVNGLQRLISESEMGELFKVIAFGRDISCALEGFRMGNRSARL